MTQVRNTLAWRAARRMVRTLSALVVVAATVVALVYLLPALLGYERYVITGGSMSGSFEKGSIAFARAVPVEELSVGDVITYLPPADSGVPNLVTHRITEMERSDTGSFTMTTQGDANADPDPWSFELQAPVQPRVELTIPLLGYVFIALADPTNRMLLIGVPAGLVALRSVLDLVRTLRPGPASDSAAVAGTAGVADAVVATGT
jgi:signal peptidase